MNYKKEGGFAFPQNSTKTGTGNDEVTILGSAGMTLRDWFAGQALNGLLSDSPVEMEKVSDWAKFAYHFADAMITKREVKDE